MFKQVKNKTFNHRSVFSKESNTDIDLESSKESNLVSKWRRESVGTRKVKGTMSIRVLILALVLLLICMYLLDSKFN